MKKTCSAFRDDLPGYRLGEGTPLERERLKAHLEGCADCRAHLAAYEQLVQDAREEPPALAIGDKDRIWKNIEKELPGTQPSLLDSLQKLFQPRWQPALGMAAACLAYLVLVNPAPQNETPTPDAANQPMAQSAESTEHTSKPLKVVVAELTQPDSHEALEVAPGVNARTTKRAKVRKTGTAHAPRVELTQGDLLAEYTRQAKQEPMVVQTRTLRRLSVVPSVDHVGAELILAVADGKVEARQNGMRHGRSRSSLHFNKLGQPCGRARTTGAEVADAMKALFPSMKPLRLRLHSNVRPFRRNPSRRRNHRQSACRASRAADKGPQSMAEC